VDPNSWKNGTLVNTALPAIMESCLNEECIKVGTLNNAVYITRQNAIHGDRPPVYLTIVSIPYWFIPLKPRLAAFNFQASTIYTVG
jgi:hypothetical protein